MSLSCSCDTDYYPEEWGETIWYFPDDFTILKTTKRKRCKGCNELINIGAVCVDVVRERMPYNEIEARILNCYDDNLIPIASWYLCEKCGEICLNLQDIGYCFDIAHDNIPELLTEYHEMTGFKKEGS